MRDILTVILAATGLIGMRLASLAWGLFKLAVLAAILIGAATNVLDVTPKLWPPFEFSFDGIFGYAKLGFSTAADAWWILALALVLVWMSGMRSAVQSIETHVGESKIALVALLNYFETEVETEGSRTTTRSVGTTVALSLFAAARTSSSFTSPSPEARTALRSS